MPILPSELMNLGRTKNGCSFWLDALPLTMKFSLFGGCCGFILAALAAAATVAVIEAQTRASSATNHNEEKERGELD